jgi:pantetheine-phosphate adenylyltransferase
MKACYPGTFDPITNGHLDIIERAAKVFDKVYVMIMVNPRKQCVFSETERKQMIEDSLKGIGKPSNVEVVIGSGLTVNMARKYDCGAIVRGIRAVSDYEYELQQATANMLLGHEIETMFFISKPQYSFLSSSAVKEIAANGGDILNLVPYEILDRVNDKLNPAGKDA